MIRDYHKIAIMAGDRNVSYHEMNQRIALFATQTPHEKDSKTLILSENREGWIYAFYSAWYNDGIAVPVDAMSTAEDVAYILNDCQPQCVWTSKGKEQLVREALRQTGLEVKILLIDEWETADVSNCPKVEERDIVEEKSTDTALIIYTSGTTGSPKGVMLTYTNLWANMNGVSREVPIYSKERRALILLPLHHVLPLMGTIIAPLMTGGGVIICPTMTGADIMDCLCRGQVGIFIGVPRLWQMLFSGIKKKIDASPVTRGLFNLCARMKSRTLSRFVFQSIQKKMGGHLDFCVSGGAALDLEIGEGLKTLGLDVLEGYGMTETAPIITFTRPGDIIPGCVGKPLPSVECKIVNGELCAKGPNVMKGYYNRPEETAAVIDPDGFIHTGDLARIDEEGRVYITGRTKEIIVLSNGKNVQPNEIEYKLEKYDQWVKEAAVTQDGDMLRAIIVPQEAWSASQTDEQVEDTLKREVIEPYNLTVENYKKLMLLTVYRGDLPRTKLDKLQRFKLAALINRKEEPAASAKEAENTAESPEFTILKEYIEHEKKLPVKPSSHLETDLAFDSLDKVGLQSFIEETFGMDLHTGDLTRLARIQDIADLIAREKTRMEVGDIDWHTILSQDKTATELPSTSPLYPFHAWAFKTYFRLHNRLTIRGTENIPANGPFILAPNHQSFMDGPIAIAGLQGKQVSHCYFYATEKHVRHSLLRFLAQRNNVIVMEQHGLKRSILKLAKVLRQGNSIAIFPEGSRSYDGQLQDFKKMFAILAKELQCPIIPVCIQGAYEALPRGTKWIKTTPISVEYLTPIQPSEQDTYDSLTEEVKRRIQEAL